MTREKFEIYINLKNICIKDYLKKFCKYYVYQFDVLVNKRRYCFKCEGVSQ